MSSPLIVPKFQFPSATPGSATSGYKVNTYAAGTSTPLATYNSSTLASANANPVIMDANGQADIWLGNASYKFVGTDASNNVLWTTDNVTQASVGSSGSEWVSFGLAPTFISATSFSLAITDLTASPYFIAIGTRIKTVNSGGTVYSTVLTVAAGTVTVKNDSGSIDSGISSASYGLVGGANSSLFRKSLMAYVGGSNVTMVNATQTALNSGGTTPVDVLSEMTGASFAAKVAGTYRVWGTVLFNEGAATTGIQNVAQSVVIAKNGTANITETINWPIAASTASTQAIPFNGTLTLVAADAVTIAVTANFTATAPTASLAAFNVERLL